MRSQFDKWCPHVVVSVHPLTQHIVAKILKELHLAEQVPLVTVVTDPCYGFWKGWACDDVSLYLVANDEARRQLLDYGIAENRIKVSGMPVDPKFREIDEADAQIARKAYGLDPDKFTVFLNGLDRRRKYSADLQGTRSRRIGRSGYLPCRQNEQLRIEAEQIAKHAKFPVKVIGYSNEIEKLMQSANVMISKLGGLTTFEAMACGLPIIADATTKPMPQEAGTVQLISDRGAGILLKRSVDIVPTIRSLIGNSRQYIDMKAATAGLTMPNSTEYIIRRSMLFCRRPSRLCRRQRESFFHIFDNLNLSQVTDFINLFYWKSSKYSAERLA